MCGITGIFTYKEEAAKYRDAAKLATSALHHRGPDGSGIFSDSHVILGHTRLSIIDTSHSSDQPFYSPDGRYVMVYNGEIFNFKELKQNLVNKGVSFHTTGDTEVLMNLFIHQGETCLDKINGFFAFAVYDKLQKSLFIARDRFGVKPLFYYSDAEKFIFSSELKSLLRYPIDKKIDHTSLLEYLQLNYIPAPNTMLEGIKKFPAGHFLKAKSYELRAMSQLPFTSYDKEPYYEGCLNTTISYEEAKKTFYNLLDDSVQKRLIADVPLGTFLSGGLDSSAITAIAALHKPNMMSFSIGYKDEPLFDETYYAELVSKKVKTAHHTFRLDNKDLFNELHHILDAMDEPFGDSSAIPVYILSKKARQYVKVSLSGDGGDELMGGYNKHLAEFKLRTTPYLKPLSIALEPIIKLFPHSRNTLTGNKFRQTSRFADGAKLNIKDRYWEWASIANYDKALRLLKNKDAKYDTAFSERKASYLTMLNEDFNSLLYADIKLVLQNDMLVKADLMSMANSLEVREPFLDYRLVEFLFYPLSPEYKISDGIQKRILRDSVAHLLPQEILTRKKQGFEVPLLKWFKTELKSSIESEWLNDDYMEEQGIFEPNEIRALKKKLYSSNPGDAVAQVWGLIAFQQWYKKTELGINN